MRSPGEARRPGASLVVLLGLLALVAALTWWLVESDCTCETWAGGKCVVWECPE